MMPHSGGQYIYLREAYGPLAAFVCGWVSFLIVQSGSIAAVWPVYELEGALIAFGPDLASAFAAAGVVATGDGVRIKGGRGFFGPVTLIPAS